MDPLPLEQLNIFSFFSVSLCISINLDIFGSLLAVSYRWIVPFWLQYDPPLENTFGMGRLKTKHYTKKELDILHLECCRNLLIVRPCYMIQGNFLSHNMVDLFGIAWLWTQQTSFVNQDLMCFVNLALEVGRGFKIPCSVQKSKLNIFER